MANQRQHIRNKSGAECVVTDDAGNSYGALLENISAGGALIKVKDGVLASLEVGDVCRMMLCDNADSCPIKRTCRVVRFDSLSMGVQFLTETFQ
ncbi:MAG TPA: PilZ domain-containing protein [Desulfuromonadales bacterium]|nr:PilZ domain-containing protein [Desulfuromonadales bacterium]